VSVSPDGRRAVSGSGDKTVRLWDLESGECLRTLEGHRSSVSSVSASPDGRRAVSGSWDRTLRLWDLESGECLAVYPANSHVHSVTTTRFGDRFICGTHDGQMHFLTCVYLPPPGLAILNTTHPDTAYCPYCATEVTPPSDVVAAILAQSALRNRQSHIRLRETASAEPLGNWQSPILSACPHCTRPLQFNPFFAAAGDYADVLRRGLEWLRRHGKAESKDALGHLKALAAHFASTGRHDEAARYAQEAEALAQRLAARRQPT